MKGWLDQGAETCSKCYYAWFKLKFSFIIKNFSSREVFDSCNEVGEADCTICDSSKNRILLSAPDPSKCICEIGWYDPGVEECKMCHYSWLLFKYLKNKFYKFS